MFCSDLLSFFALSNLPFPLFFLQSAHLCQEICVKKVNFLL